MKLLIRHLIKKWQQIQHFIFIKNSIHTQTNVQNIVSYNDHKNNKTKNCSERKGFSH